MDAKRAARADLAVDAHRLLRIDVVVAHEPARLVVADGDGGEVERPEPGQNQRSSPNGTAKPGGAPR